jgi:methylase of polypeptide subunit release factors
MTIFTLRKFQGIIWGRPGSENPSVSPHSAEVKFQYLGEVPPLVIGPRKQFSKLRGFLVDSNYSEAQVCQRLGLKQAKDFLNLRPNPASPRAIHDHLDFLARLLLIGETVEEKEMQTWVPTAVREAMAGLGLVAAYPGRTGSWYATAALYPAYGVWIASDRWSSPELAPIRVSADVVYPAITPNTAHFMATLPTDPCDSLLDLCTGSGVAAIVAASGYAREVLAADITEAAERSVEFNRLLNGLENLRVARGDLYEAAGDATFDRILAHPPYMPSLKPAEIYAYGGELGEDLTRSIIEGLPYHLRPGGRFYCVTAGAELATATFETRLRSWLGERGAEFDVFVLERQLFDPGYVANRQAAKTRGGLEEVDQWKALFERYRLEHLVYSAVVVQRKDSATPPVTVRRRKGRRFGSAEIEWLRVWETSAVHPDFLAHILDSKPVATRDLELHTIHRVQDGELAAQDFSLETNYPFTVQCAIRPWAGFLIARCDGKTPARDMLAYLKENQLLAADESEEQFADFLRVLISGGFLEIEGFRLPPQ